MLMSNSWGVNIGQKWMLEPKFDIDTLSVDTEHKLSINGKTENARMVFKRLASADQCPMADNISTTLTYKDKIY